MTGLARRTTDREYPGIGKMVNRTIDGRPGRLHGAEGGQQPLGFYNVSDTTGLSK